MTNALQDSAHAVRIEVDSPEVCETFEGDGNSPIDRFLRIDGGATLTCNIGMKKTIGTPNYLVRFQDGASGAPTKIVVDGDVTGIDFLKANHNSGDWVKIDVGGDMTDVDVTLGSNFDIDVAGKLLSTVPNASIWTLNDKGTVDILGDVRDATVTVGLATETSGDGTIVKVGSIGDPNATTGDWTLRGFTDLTVSATSGTGNYNGSDETVKVTMSESSKMTVEGLTTRASWVMSNDALFTGEGAIKGGIPNTRDDAIVHAQADVNGGDWTVEYDGNSGDQWLAPL